MRASSASSPDEAVRLLLAAVDAGLQPWGLTFHVGSQMTDPQAWVAPIRDAADDHGAAPAARHPAGGLDIGGGFPADYGHPVPPIEDYGVDHPAGVWPPCRTRSTVLAEPGRGLVADAGRLETTVIGTADGTVGGGRTSTSGPSTA